MSPITKASSEDCVSWLDSRSSNSTPLFLKSPIADKRVGKARAESSSVERSAHFCMEINIRSTEAWCNSAAAEMIWFWFLHWSLWESQEAFWQSRPYIENTAWNLKRMWHKVIVIHLLTQNLTIIHPPQRLSCRGLPWQEKQQYRSSKFCIFVFDNR